MGVFEYECPAGHVTDHYVALFERPAEIPCEHVGGDKVGGADSVKCELMARYIVSAARTTFHANDRKAIKGTTVNRGGIRT